MLSFTDFGIGGEIHQRRNKTLRYGGENLVNIAAVKNLVSVHLPDLHRGGNLSK